MKNVIIVLCSFLIATATFAQERVNTNPTVEFTNMQIIDKKIVKWQFYSTSGEWKERETDDIQAVSKLSYKGKDYYAITIAEVYGYYKYPHSKQGFEAMSVYSFYIFTPEEISKVLNLSEEITSINPIAFTTNYKSYKDTPDTFIKDRKYLLELQKAIDAKVSGKNTTFYFKSYNDVVRFLTPIRSSASEWSEISAPLVNSYYEILASEFAEFLTNFE